MRVLVCNIKRSALGHKQRGHDKHVSTLPGIGDDEIFCQSLGSGAWRRLAVPGALNAHYVSYIDPTSFTLHESIFVLSIIVGGIGMGSLAAAAFMILVPNGHDKCVGYARFPHLNPTHEPQAVSNPRGHNGVPTLRNSRLMVLNSGEKNWRLRSLPEGEETNEHLREFQITACASSACRAASPPTCVKRFAGRR